jgi:hypothetical protein
VILGETWCRIDALARVGPVEILRMLAGGSSGGFDPVEAKPGDRSIRRDL